MKHKIELLSPAGDLERLKTAVRYGANAVYIGGKKFSLRSRASNFELEDIKEAVTFAHSYQALVYVTCNMVLHNEDMEGAKEYLEQLGRIGVDAIICESMSFAMLSKSVAPKMEVHLSTQFSTLNLLTIQFFKEQGIDRIVLARELSLQQIHYLAQNSPLPLEVFIHGAMCMSYSGRCMLSNHMTMRDANRGGCAQSCRWKYHLYNQDKVEISEEDCLFSMSSKDLMAYEYIEALMKMNIASLKIEGRMKSAYYIATVVGAYRRLIDAYDNNEAVNLEVYKNELSKAENRPASIGFFAGLPRMQDHLYGVNGAGVTQEYLGSVISYDAIKKTAKVEVKNHFIKGCEVEVFGAHIFNQHFVIDEMYDSEMNIVEVANKPMQILEIALPFEVNPFDMLRKVR